MNCGGKMASSALEIQGLEKRYGEQAAVDGVDLQLAPGESLAIIGHNGAGKTTLMKLILGLTRPSAGTIQRWSWRGGAPRPAAASEGIGFLPESVNFPGAVSGGQRLRFYARLKGAGKQECAQLLELVGLSDAADRKINTYSKGMRQRLGLAQALLGSPELLLLDEPTSGLDPFLRQHFYAIIGQRQAAGASVIISSHALTEIEARTDRIAIMQRGRVLALGSLATLREQAALPVEIKVRHTAVPMAELEALAAGAATLQSMGELSTRFSCTESEKLALLQRLSARPDIVQDLSLHPPGLDDLYAYFVNGGDT
ncbi:ABC transporter ATP-binding protein [Seongchinamella unica]|nr:ABC transporter ATP-binding protein [Seongchinamella unica]